MTIENFTLPLLFCGYLFVRMTQEMSKNLTLYIVGVLQLHYIIYDIGIFKNNKNSNQ